MKILSVILDIETFIKTQSKHNYEVSGFKFRT
jgi:hypothetical protein